MHSHSAIVSLLLLSATSQSQATVNLLVLGDWGGMPVRPYTTPGQVATAKGMGVIGEKLNAQAVLALGDNFYTYGIQGTEESHRFKDTWDSVYTSDSLQVPWYLIAGNHDYKGNVSAQIAYSNDNDRWMYPDLYHAATFTSSPTSKFETRDGKSIRNEEEDVVTVDVVLIDTIDLSGSSTAVSTDDPEYFKPLPYKPRQEAAAQWDWIEARLSNSTADYLIVGGHFPVYSVCEHGNTQNLIDHLKPLLEQYGAHYFSGHDHCMESISETSDGEAGSGTAAVQVQYILSGMGDTCCYADSNLENIPEGVDVPWYISRGHNHERGTIGGFSSITANPSEMTVSFYDQDGTVLYTTPAISPRADALKKKKNKKPQQQEI